MQDAFGRKIDTLRISVTDRCNFRCRYCMPPEGLQWMPRKSAISFEDITAIARAFLELGGSRLRITGGEPLLRQDLPRLVGMLSVLPGLRYLGMTTNASHLLAHEESLWNVGLRHLNISLDIMNPVAFRWITLSDSFSRVMAGIEASLARGFHVKLNSVVLRGICKRDVHDLVQFAIERHIEVRFIEFMPLCGSGWKPEYGFPMQTVRDWVAEKWNLNPLTRGTAPAESFEIAGTSGRVGFIESLSNSFCSTCSRVRLGANGQLRLCLFSKAGIDLKPHLEDPDVLKKIMREAIWHKPPGHAAVPITEWNADNHPIIQAVGG